MVSSGAAFTANSTLHGIGGSANVLKPRVDTSQGCCI